MTLRTQCCLQVTIMIEISWTNGVVWLSLDVLHQHCFLNYLGNSSCQGIVLNDQVLPIVDVHFITKKLQTSVHFFPI